jgi:hypothetical protein
MPLFAAFNGRFLRTFGSNPCESSRRRTSNHPRTGRRLRSIPRPHGFEGFRLIRLIRTPGDQGFEEDVAGPARSASKMEAEASGGLHFGSYRFRVRPAWGPVPAHVSASTPAERGRAHRAAGPHLSLSYCGPRTLNRPRHSTPSSREHSSSCASRKSGRWPVLLPPASTTRTPVWPGAMARL